VTRSRFWAGLRQSPWCAGLHRRTARKCSAAHRLLPRRSRQFSATRVRGRLRRQGRAAHPWSGTPAAKRTIHRRREPERVPLAYSNQPVSERPPREAGSRGGDRADDRGVSPHTEISSPVVGQRSSPASAKSDRPKSFRGTRPDRDTASLTGKGHLSPEPPPVWAWGWSAASRIAVRTSFSSDAAANSPSNSPASLARRRSVRHRSRRPSTADRLTVREFVIAYLAIAALGAAVVPANSMSTRGGARVLHRPHHHSAARCRYDKTRIDVDAKFN
jgi:hypothetical protein